jgi:Xaa-Pro aminopeptidase
MEIFKKRRNLLLDQLTDGIALIPSAEYKTRSHDTDYPFRQDSNFKYLTGFLEPGALLLLCKNHPDFKTILFVRPKDHHAEIWSGRRLGVEAGQETLGVDKVHSILDLDKELPGYLQNHKNVYLDIFGDSIFFKKIISKSKILNDAKKIKKYSPQNFFHLGNFLSKMRLIKEPWEIEQIKKANSISNLAHRAAMSLARPGILEFEVAAAMEYIFKKNGASHHAYESIVAGGDNANILHYTNNNEILKDGDLLLIDAGAEFNLYASDITRTFPVNKKFSGPQKALYEIVLNAQKAVIENSLPGKTLAENHQVALKILTQGLIDLKILKGGLDENLEKGNYKAYYPHGTGHWLGLDVHDHNPYLEEDLSEIKFKPGMVFTVEPGLYLGLNDQNIPQEFQGIGIRIEDDILITDNGNINLSREIPKEIKDVEEACHRPFDLHGTK